MQKRLVVAAALSICVQAWALHFLPWLYALVASVFAGCCAFLLLLMHPAVSVLAGAGNQLTTIAPAEFTYHPIVQAAMRMPSPPAPWAGSIWALLAAAAADGLDGLRIWLAPSTTCDLLHQLCGTACAAAWLRSAWPLGASPNRALARSCWTVCGAAAVQLLISSPQPAEDAPYPELALHVARACRTLTCAGLVAHSLNALLGCLGWGKRRRADSSDMDDSLNGRERWELIALNSDRARWVAQAAGAALLLASSAAEVKLLGADVRAACLGAQRLGVGCLTLSSWLSLQPRAPGEDGELSDGTGAGGGGYQTVEQMRAARRAAREAAIKKCADAPPPLLVESWHGRGGMQGLAWHDQALCRDGDGDEAHDFWEAIRGGLFRRCPVKGHS